MVIASLFLHGFQVSCCCKEQMGEGEWGALPTQSIHFSMPSPSMLVGPSSLNKSHTSLMGMRLQQAPSLSEPQFSPLTER